MELDNIEAMKRLMYLFVALLALSCTEKDGPADGGNDDTGKEMAECVCPASVRAGDDALLQWEGFKDGDALSAVSKDGDEYTLVVNYITASGLGFTVPVDVPAGKYMLVLVRSERKELGEIEITAPAMPITGLAAPDGALCGETVLFGGVGYKQGSSILFDGESDVTLVPVITNSGAEVVLPEDMQEGSYDVYLLQDNLQWLLKSGFAVAKEIVKKELAEIRYYTPYVGTELLMLSWTISRDGSLVLDHSQYVVSEDEETLDVYDSYVADGDYSFVLEHDGYEYSDNVNFSYTFDDGVVSQADVVRINGKSIVYQWKYDAQGFMTEIALPSRSMYYISYDLGNVVAFDQVRYEYGDPTLVNAPYAPDVAWAFKVLNEWAYPAACFPYLLGWYEKSSTQLPTKMYQPNLATGSGEIECPLTYEFDSDGFVSRMSWTAEGSKCWIEFEYVE